MLVMDEQRSHPVGGIDYPQTLQEFDEWFATEDNCARYLMRLRWPQAFHCPSCGSQESWLTSWTWLHKLRRAMVRPGRDMLKGHIEVDETYIGGEEEGLRGRKTETKSIVVIAIEVHSPKGFGRLRLRQVPDVTGPSLVGFVKEVVTVGSIVSTDGWTGYNGFVCTRI